jgi:hypothetical protein
MNRSLAAAALITLCSVAHASPAPETTNGFLTGKLFQGGSQSLRTAYVIGVLDGFSYSSAFGAPDAKVGKLQRCIGTLHADARQVGTIIDKYIDAHPESLTEKMQPVVLSAMRQACAASGAAID